MIFGPGSDKNPDVSLCIFPSLSEFVAVDSRPRPGAEPRWVVLRVSEVFDERFYARVEREFSKLLRRPDHPFQNLMGLPHEIEGIVRMHSMQAVLDRLDAERAHNLLDGVPNVAVLFCTGPFLSMEQEGLRRAVTELLSGQLAGADLKECVDTVVRLSSEERKASGAAGGSELSNLIRGDGDNYATLWQNRDKG